MNEIVVELEKEGDYLNISIDYDHWAPARVGEIRYTLVKQLEKNIVNELTAYEQNPNEKKLKKLINAGYEAYKEFRSKFTSEENHIYAQMWDERFGKLPLRNNQNFPFVKRIRIVVSKGYTFPFNLLYVRDPESIDWKIERTNDIFDFFIGMRFRVYFRTFEKRSSPVATFFKQNQNQRTDLIHAIDKNLVTTIEEAAWNLDNTINYDPKVYRKDDLFQKWFNPKTHHIIHFSNHLKLENLSSIPKQYLTISDGYNVDKIYKSDIGLETPIKSKPLIFFNNCRSAVGHFDLDDPLLSIIYPRYSIGFIATLFAVKNNNAQTLAYNFYDYFLKGETIIESLYKARDSVTSTSSAVKFYSSVGYVIWEIHPDSRMFPIENSTRKKRQSHKLKIKRNNGRLKKQK